MRPGVAAPFPWPLPFKKKPACYARPCRPGCPPPAPGCGAVRRTLFCCALPAEKTECAPKRRAARNRARPVGRRAACSLAEGSRQPRLCRLARRWPYNRRAVTGRCPGRRLPCTSGHTPKARFGKSREASFPRAPLSRFRPCTAQGTGAEARHSRFPAFAGIVCSGACDTCIPRRLPHPESL